MNAAEMRQEVRVSELLNYLARHGIKARWQAKQNKIVAEELLVGADGQPVTETVWLNPTAQDVRAFLGY